MHRIKGAEGFIFDCDGTLLDSLSAWEDAERDLFAQAGPLTREQEDEIHSAPIEQAAELLHCKYGVGESAAAVLDHLDNHLLCRYRDEVRAMPGACEFVQRVSRDVPCVVLSSSPRRYLEAGLERVGILDCFRELVTTDEVGVSKRDFAIYDHALKVLGSKRESTWAVDDAPYAIDVMSRFGLNTIGLAAGRSGADRRRLEECASVVVETLCDLTIQ